MRVLLIAPFYDKHTAGESWSTYKWVEEISNRCETTVLTTHHKDWVPENSPIEAKSIVNWPDPKLPDFLRSINRGAKPTYLLFYFRARRWIKNAISKDIHFDIIHQINPLALRYPSPASELSSNFLIGPLAGSIETPAPLVEVGKQSEPWYRRFRNIDRWRIQNDHWLKSTYSNAACVIGVAPYVEETLRPCNLKGFKIMSETGVEFVAQSSKPPHDPNKALRLLFVGRIIYTKGILNAIRAVAIAAETVRIHFDVIGEGELLETCKNEAQKLNISNIIKFHGRLPREEVDSWYERSSVFLFPSFREPSGNVVFEAMGKGLPVITSTVGGPGYVVNNQCGRTIPPNKPEIFEQEIANAIVSFCENQYQVHEMSRAALKRVKELSQWNLKIDRLIKIYETIANTKKE